jgi:eukaryotic-like serine/threonine-protein kinase
VAEQSNADYRGSLGRYALYGEIAAGGMATVHLGRLLGPVGFARTVAIKRLHPHLAKDPEFVAMFLEEARLAARVRHPNVVPTLDVVSEDGELFLVMEYVAGESLSRLVRKTREAGGRVSVKTVITILCGALEGLHGAHEARTEKGAPLGLVHRDVSPQNIHVGLDGVPRLLDFGIAKATNRVQETRTDQIKGKVAYMSPEQLAKGNVDRRADVYSASVVLWEALTGERLFKADDVASLVYSIVNDEIRPPSRVVPELPAGIDEIVMKGLDRDQEKRWPTAREMAEALEKLTPLTAAREIGEWVESTAGDALDWRQELVRRVEAETSTSMPPPMPARVQSPASPIEVGSGVRASAPQLPEIIEVHHAAASSTRTPEVSIYDPSEATPRSRASLVAMSLAGALLVGGAALFGLRWMQLASVEAPGSGADPHAAPSGSTNEQAIVIGVQRNVPSASASVPVVAPVLLPKPSATAAPRASTTPAHDECDNPFVVDSRGIRHPKPQCFKH